MEFLRILMSKQGAAKFVELTNSLTVVEGATEGLKLSTALKSVTTAIEAAGKDAFYWRFNNWYPKLNQEVVNATGALMAGDISVSKWQDRCQKMADKTAQDDSTKKFER